MKDLDLSLHVISEERPARGRSHLDVARAACAGGAGVFQLRVKGGSPPDVLALARAAVATCRAAGVACIVNDFPEIAAAAGAAGSHVGAEDMPLDLALALAERHGLVVGASATTLEEALRAQAAGAHYLGVGPIFPTGSKPDAAPPLGLEGLRAVCARVRLPVVAIGGIGLEQVREVIAAGAAGVAVISAVTTSDDMAETVRELRRQVDAALRECRTTAGQGGRI
ncbi:MAG: thiamine phosphate synthase [Thermoleophilia bacterium]